jgi:ABC-type amino acid transport substrate-binding protein
MRPIRHSGLAFSAVTVLTAMLAAPSAARAAAEIPFLIAGQTDAQGKPLPTPSVITGLVDLLAAESGLNLVVRPYPWRRAQLMAEHGEGVLYGLATTPERLQTMNFSKPLYFAYQWLVTPAQNSFPFQQWDDLRGKVISIQSGGRFGAEFEDRRGKLFTVEDNSSNVSSRLKMLSIGRVDALLIDSYRSAPRFEARINCVYGEIGKWTVLEKPVDTEPVLIAVAKSSKFNAVLPAINDAIERLTKSQSMQKMLEKTGTNTGC